MDTRNMRKSAREIKEIDEILEILKKCDVCRIGFIDDDYPYIVPMSFGYSYYKKLTLYFHCALVGKKLDIINKNNNVCFECDCSHELITGEEACQYSMNYESLIGFGKISIIKDEVERIFALNCLMKQYGREENLEYNSEVMARTTMLKIEVESFTGKRLKK